MELRDLKKIGILILVVVLCWGLTIPLVKSQESFDKQMGVVGSTPVVSQSQNLSVLFIGFNSSPIDSQSI